MQTTRFTFSARRFSLTYGTLPSLEIFRECWLGDVGPTRSYSVRNCKLVGDVDYTSPEELYVQLETFVAALDAYQGWEVDEGQCPEGDWCSAVLSTFGIEWV